MSKDRYLAGESLALLVGDWEFFGFSFVRMVTFADELSRTNFTKYFRTEFIRERISREIVGISPLPDS